MPRASILITAYNRKDYLRQAIDSALDQDVDFPYEVVLTKNFDDQELDAYCSTKSVKLVKYTSESLGEMTGDGVSNCTGDIILFLDDDDMFSRNKLRETISYFDQHSKLGLVHNSFSAINVDSEETPDRRHRHPIEDIHLMASHLPKNLIQIIETNSGNVNLSSVSIRRSIADENIDFIRQIWGNPDTFFALLTLIRGYDVVLSSKVLTKYRIHESASKGRYGDTSSLREHLLDLQNKYNTSYDVLSSIKPNPNLGSTIEYESVVSRLRVEILEHSRKKQLSIREVFRVLNRTSFDLLTLSLLFFKILHSLSPTLFSGIYVQFRKRLMIHYYRV